MNQNDYIKGYSDGFKDGLEWDIEKTKKLYLSMKKFLKKHENKK